jgi:toxin HigB-1
MASAALAIASSKVSLAEEQPGRSGTVAPYRTPSSVCRTTGKRMFNLHRQFFQPAWLHTPPAAVGGLMNVTQRYTLSPVIRSFTHKGLEAFFRTGSKAGIQPAHAAKLRRQLAQLDQAESAQDVNVPGWRLHPLTGNLAGHWSVWVNGNWRLTFRFRNGDAELVDYCDYH